MKHRKKGMKEREKGVAVVCPLIKRGLLPSNASETRSAKIQPQRTKQRSTRAVSISGHPTLTQFESPLTSIPSMAATLLYSPSSPNHGIDTHRPP
jgi:hypothetical protein